jgi:ribosome-associated translation inhibitor RaiA
MQIDIRGQNVPLSGALAAHCIDRLDRALRRVSSRIACVHVVLVDIGGPKTLNAKACRTTVDFVNGGRVRFESRTDSYYLSASQSISGAVRRVQRELERRRTTGPEQPMAPQPAA